VPGIVAQTAGANKGMQVSGGNCSPQNPPASSATPRPSNPAPSSPAASSPTPSRPAPSSSAPSSPPPGTSAGCTATYAITGQWGGGFQGDVKVTATGAINGWTVTWTYANGQSIQSAWNAAITSNGSSVTARNVSYNGKLSAGQSTNFGFTGSVTGSNSAPSVSCTAG
jgi:mannan endo-1,4-beta-mannosidase